MEIRFKEGSKVCLRCGHLYIETDNESKKICLCKNPVLSPASRVHSLSITELRRLPEFQPSFGKQEQEFSLGKQSII